MMMFVLMMFQIIKFPAEYLDQPTSKQHAVWTKDAILSLLSLYKAKKNMLNNPRKKVKIWEAISNGLMDFGIQMSCDQVRWKFNVLTKKYKECVDNNSASGRGAMTFEFYDQLVEIFGQQSNAIETCVMSSTLPLENSEASILKKQLPLKNLEPSILKNNIYHSLIVICQLQLL